MLEYLVYCICCLFILIIYSVYESENLFEKVTSSLNQVQEIKKEYLKFG